MAAILAPVLAGAMSLAGQGINALTQGSMNRKTREYNEKMYAKQRADSISDWNMQNSYNSPQSQMARLKAAGLNPNLVYGEGSVANNSALPRQVSQDSWKPEAPRFDLGGAATTSLSTYYDVQIKEAQANNLKATNAVLQQDALLKAAQTAATVQGTSKSQFDLGQAQTLSQYIIEQARANLRATTTTTDLAISANERAATKQTQDLAKGVEEILSMRLGRAKTQEEIRLITEQMRNLRADLRLKELDINLKKRGINPSDPTWQRVLAQLAAGVDPSNIKIDPKRDNWADRQDSTSKRKLGIPSGTGDPYRNP